MANSNQDEAKCCSSFFENFRPSLKAHAKVVQVFNSIQLHHIDPVLTFRAEDLKHSLQQT